MFGDGESVQDASYEEEKRQLLERCLCAAEESPEAQRALLLAGLQITESWRPIEEDNSGAAAEMVGNKSLAAASIGGGVDRQWWRWQRLLVLQHLERLDTVLALYKG